MVRAGVEICTRGRILGKVVGWSARSFYHAPSCRHYRSLCGFWPIFTLNPSGVRTAYVAPLDCHPSVCSFAHTTHVFFGASALTRKNLSSTMRRIEPQVQRAVEGRQEARRGRVAVEQRANKVRFCSFCIHGRRARPPRTHVCSRNGRASCRDGPSLS